MEPVLELLSRHSSVRDFLPEPVPDTVRAVVIEVALTAAGALAVAAPRHIIVVAQVAADGARKGAHLRGAEALTIASEHHQLVPDPPVHVLGAEVAVVEQEGHPQGCPLRHCSLLGKPLPDDVASVEGGEKEHIALRGGQLHRWARDRRRVC